MMHGTFFFESFDWKVCDSIACQIWIQLVSCIVVAYGDLFHFLALSCHLMSLFRNIHREFWGLWSWKNDLVLLTVLLLFFQTTSCWVSSNANFPMPLWLVSLPRQPAMYWRMPRKSSVFRRRLPLRLPSIDPTCSMRYSGTLVGYYTFLGGLWLILFYS